MAAAWRERLSEWGIEVGQKIIWSLDKWYARKSKVGDHAFFDNRDFAWVPRIEADWGIKAFKNCKRCPETTKVLKQIPGMKTAMFSIFAPHKRLPEHRGAYKGVLRLHLGLLIPEPAEQCGIRVGTETRHWAEGKAMIFDDCFPHEAWNETDGRRVVLFVDVVRPMRFPANLVNDLMIRAIALSPFVLGSAGNYLRWERRFEKIVNQGAPTH